MHKSIRQEEYIMYPGFRNILKLGEGECNVTKHTGSFVFTVGKRGI